MVEVHGGVCGHAALHQLRELADVHPALAQPREDPGVAPVVEVSTTFREKVHKILRSFRRCIVKSFAKFRRQLYPVGVVPIVPGPAGADPDDGGAVVDVGGQVGVVRTVLLRDLLTLHHHLVMSQ